MTALCANKLVDLLLVLLEWCTQTAVVCVASAGAWAGAGVGNHGACLAAEGSGEGPPSPPYLLPSAWYPAEREELPAGEAVTMQGHFPPSH